MQVHYYLSVSPIEALIASQLPAEQFGSYMAIGAKNGSRERIMFIEIEGPFASAFDWDYAKERCVPHPDGRPKNSVWVSVYRVIENTPFEALGTMYLTTADGRTLALQRGDLAGAPGKPFYIYQELAPITPLVASALNPADFAASLTNPSGHVSVPKVVFSDLKVIDFDNPTDTGNIGAAYDKNLEHLKACVTDVTSNPDKPNKNVERSVSSFAYQIIDRAVYVGNMDQLVTYPMPSLDALRRDHYDWGRSAMIF